MGKVPDERIKDTHRQRDLAADTEQRRRSVQQHVVDENLEPVKSAIADPIHLADSLGGKPVGYLAPCNPPIADACARNAESLRLVYDCAWPPSQAQTIAKAIGSGTKIREPTYATAGPCVSCIAKHKPCPMRTLINSRSMPVKHEPKR